MNRNELNSALKCAVNAARAAGALMRQHLHSPKIINEASRHDIKLELDVRCQQLIERHLRKDFPAFSVLGEEGSSGPADAPARWVVDPIDGTVNFAHNVPHACVCVALQVRGPRFKVQRPTSAPRSRKVAPSSIVHSPESHQTVIGVVYDPFCDELWTATRGQPARMNGRVIHVSRRAKLAEAMVCVGLSKSQMTLKKTLPYFGWVARRTRKIRLMGAAGLGLAYVACGRFDAYAECRVRLWDIAAGALIVECAGGQFWCERLGGFEAYRMLASNGRLHDQLPTPR